MYSLSYMPFILIAATFSAHALRGILGAQESMEIVSALGFSYDATRVLVLLAGFLDAAVVLMLLTKDKLFGWLPWSIVYLWTGAWPIVPRAIVFLGGGPFEWIEVLIFSALSFVAYAAHRWRLRQRESLHRHLSNGQGA